MHEQFLLLLSFWLNVLNISNDIRNGSGKKKNKRKTNIFLQKKKKDFFSFSQMIHSTAISSSKYIRVKIHLQYRFNLNLNLSVRNSKRQK